MNTGDNHGKDKEPSEADEQAFNDALKRMLKSPPKPHSPPDPKTGKGSKPKKEKDHEGKDS